MVFDGIVDGCGGKNGIEATFSARCCIVFAQNGIHNCLFGGGMGGGNGFIAFGFVIIDMEFQDVAVVNGIGDGVGM